MSEQAPEVVHTTETEAPKAQTDPTPDTKPEPKAEPDTGQAAEVAKWKAMARKHEENAKANAKAAERLAEIENAQKTEQERATEAVQKAAAQAEQEKARADAADAKVLRYEVAFEKGLTPAQAKRLVGTSREELEADADDILANFSVKTDGRPKGDADQGVRTAPAVKVVAPGMDTVRYAYDTASSTGS